MRPIYLALVACLIATAALYAGADRIEATQAASGNDSTWPSYQISASLNYQLAHLDVTEKIHYTNTTSVTLDRVVLNVTPAAFGAFTLDRAQVDGQPAQSSLEGVALEVRLSEALHPGESVEIALDFQLDLPRQGGRFGVAEGIIALGNWFPIVAVYREGRLEHSDAPAGWDRHHYVSAGDAFYTGVGDFDVDLSVSTPVKIAHSGELAHQEGNRWVFRSRRARDFALAISNRYETTSRVVDGITITSFYLPSHANEGTDIVRAASEAVVWLSRTITPYPYPTLMIAEVSGQLTDQVGQEYPGAIFLTNSAFADAGNIGAYLSYLTLHEVTHQWFYGIVGNDQVYEPWLDEATVTWLTLDFYRQNYPDRFPALWRQRVEASLDAAIRSVGERPVDTGIYDYRHEADYFGIVYRRGAVFLEEVADQIGHDRFYAALRDYVATHQYEIARTWSLLSALERQSPNSILPIAARYFADDDIQASAVPPRLELEVTGPNNADLPNPNRWPSRSNLDLATSSPLKQLSLYVDNRRIEQRPDAETIGIGPLETGDHLLTIVAYDEDGRRAEWARRVNVQTTPAPTPSPTASESPATPEAPTPVAVVTQTAIAVTPSPTAVTPERVDQSSPPSGAVVLVGLAVAVAGLFAVALVLKGR